MIGKTWTAAGIAVVALAGFASAQTAQSGAVLPGQTVQSGTVLPGQIVSPGTVVVDPRFTDPRITFFDPRLGFNGSSLGFTPGVTGGNFFIPANGDGFFFYNPWGPWGYSGPIVDARGAWLAARPTFASGVRVPIAGLNSPPLSVGARRVTRVVDGGSGSGYDYASLAAADAISGNDLPAPAGGVIETAPPPERLALGAGRTTAGVETLTPPRMAVRGSTTVLRTTDTVVNVAEIDPQQVRLAGRMEDVMEDGPLTEGTVVSIQDGGVIVRYERNGETHIERFSTGRVFFFRGGSALATASTDGRALRPGDEVLVPLPVTPSITRQSVAGSRQEIAPRVRVRRRPAK